MLSPWLTAASMRLRGRSQKTPVGSKGVWAGVVVGWVAAVLAALGTNPLEVRDWGAAVLATPGFTPVDLAG